ncbi:hypothetical protein [Streptomyces sp. TLI_171]|uniref:hypothetical protein n=1 Tax=Streptomyces sp. TLI_171 TaxID=1938859 RepID=UPI000C19837A|nr:hypothetical protein [Streptomyces sp. TLI_171]RKE20502.1 hypothetical protein BX266_3865 [Streptomyces sp. TLI_171]
MLVTRVSKLIAFSALTIAALVISAGSVEFAGNVADGADTVQTTAFPTSTPAPIVQLGGDVTWGG